MHRNVYGSIKHAQMKKELKTERINQLCFIGLFLAGVVAYIAISA